MRYVGVSMVEDIADKGFHMGVCQAVIHIPTFTPAPYELFIQEDPQSL